MTRRWTPALAVVLTAAACGGGSPIARLTTRRPPHEVYAASLKEAGLDKSAVGAAWFAQASQALQSPHLIALPFRESGYFDPTIPAAAGYWFELPRGRVLAIDLTLDASRSSRLFIDLFRVTDTSVDRVASAEEGRPELRYVSRADGAYVLRLQPELLGGGRYDVVQRTEASLRFPVQGVSELAVHSVFGDARDGGRREHHGVDIFAPRGTPVVAAAEGRVRRTDTTDIGGRVIWLYDVRHRQSIYYAHLDDWAVRAGQNVTAGDVLGYVGNTGNARSTAPHLHFGIYSGGPVDPLPSIRASDRTPGPPSAPANLIGRWARVARAAPLHATSAPGGGAAAQLPIATPLHLRAAAGGAFRVALPDGRTGFVVASAVAPLDRPMRTARLRHAAALREGPSEATAAIRPLREGVPITVFGAFNGFLLARLDDGQRGWVAETMIRP